MGHYDDELDDFLADFDPKFDSLETKTFPGDSFPTLTEFEKFSPVFGYDYISLKQSEWCFDHSSITLLDFISIFSKKKEISWMSYKDLHDAKGTGYRFHHVDLGHKDRRHLKEKLIDLMDLDPTDRLIPDIYQFEVYTDSQSGKAPRILGFVGKLGVFYLLWFDQYHQAYKSKV